MPSSVSQHEVYIVYSYFPFPRSQQPFCCCTESMMWKNCVISSSTVSPLRQFILVNDAFTNLADDARSPGSQLAPMPLLYAFRSSSLLNLFSGSPAERFM